MPGIRSIKTPYRGTTFQSTLEADWAKTLDRLKIRWSYEPEGLKLPDGQNYRCDFFLPQVDTWLEVKGPHNQRIDKPAVLADSLVHAPGCRTGEPVQVFNRPDGCPPGDCSCGFSTQFPYQLLVVGRLSVAGKMVFESPHAAVAADARMVVLLCDQCGQYSFADAHGWLVCRRCWQLATGSTAYPSGALPFKRVEPPRGKPRKG